VGGGYDCEGGECGGGVWGGGGYVFAVRDDGMGWDGMGLYRC
jgi:hypothetical protein